jgi:hypothetical protein
LFEVPYNEFDPHAAAWLRNLNGDVDERSITDVAPDLAGIGGWPAALRLAGLARRPAGLDGIVSLPAVHTTCWINCGLEASLLLGARIFAEASASAIGTTFVT